MKEETENDPDPDFERVKKAVADLGEHFDTVQIFATRYEDDGTINCNYGSGNWFARRGQIGDWLIKREEDSRCDSRKDHQE